MSALTVTRRTRALARPSQRSAHAGALLGICLDDPHTTPTPRTIEIETPPASITLVTGPSGTGKTTLLADIARAAERARYRVIDPEQTNLPSVACVDLFDGSTLDAMRAMSRAGLADASIFTARADRLSLGESARLRLARAMHHAEQDDTRATLLVLDEFASHLDPITALALARLLRRFVDCAPHVRAIVATHRTELAPALACHAHLAFNTSGALTNLAPAARADPFNLVIEPASRDALASLLPLHYRAGKPATVVRTLVAREVNTNAIAGTLGVSMPTLNAPWRDLAWPARYRSSDKRLDAHKLNDEVRCISRVIIDPRFRGIGVARRLVSAYLDDPLTPHTEAAAAMGLASPFFERAGMRAYRVPPSDRNTRLLDALAHIHVEQLQLATPAIAWRTINTRGASRFIERELLRWAKSSRSTCNRPRGNLFALFREACRSLISTPIGYAHAA